MVGRMSNAISIETRAAGTSGRYVGQVEGVDGEAELRFTVRGPSLISADHTEAPASMRGTGAALALVEHMIDDARSNGFKIFPICPYVLAQYKKHPERSDVMMSGAQEDDRPLQPNSLTHEFIRILAKARDLPRIRFHNLRLTHATQLLASGIQPKVAQERLGHSSVLITLDLYSHVLPGMREDASAKVDAAIRAAIEGN